MCKHIAFLIKEDPENLKTKHFFLSHQPQGCRLNSFNMPVTKTLQALWLKAVKASNILFKYYVILNNQHFGVVKRKEMIMKPYLWAGS